MDENEVILFEDECSLKKSATFTHMWAPKGEQPRIETDSDRSRLNIFGTVNPLAGEICYQLVNQQKTDTFQDFLEHLLIRYADKTKIFLVLDNAKIHHAKQIQEFLAGLDENGPQIELLFQPPYSPELNVIERVWKFMRKQVTHNTFFSTMQNLITALQSFFQNFLTPSKTIQSLCKIL